MYFRFIGQRNSNHLNSALIFWPTDDIGVEKMH